MKVGVHDDQKMLLEIFFFVGNYFYSGSNLILLIVIVPLIKVLKCTQCTHCLLMSREKSNNREGQADLLQTYVFLLGLKKALHVTPNFNYSGPLYMNIEVRGV